MADPKLKEWCARARKLLKTAKAGQQNAAIKNLPEYLSKLESEDPAAYGRYKGEFEAVMKTLDQLAQAGSKDEKKFKDEADKLALLKDKVRAAVALEKWAVELSNLSPSDHPEVLKLHTKLDAAHNLLNANNPEGAEFAVKDFAALIKTAKSSIDTTQKLASENRKAYPNVSKKRADMEALLLKLRTVYSGHQPLEAQLEKALADTKVAAARGDWVDVHAVIKGITLPTDDECQRTSQSQLTEAGKTNTDVARINTALAKLKLALEATELLPYQEACNKVLNPYLAAKGPERVEAGGAVKTQADKIDQDVLAVADMQRTLTTLLGELKTIKDYLDQHAPVTSTEAQAVRNGIQQFETAMTVKRLFAAERLAKSLAIDAREQHAAIKADRDIFIEASRSLDKLQLLAKTLEQTANGLSTGSLKRDIMAAVGTVDQKNILAQTAQTRDWPALTARIARANKTLAELSLREQDYQAFKVTSDQMHNEQVVPLLREVDRAIAALKKVYNDAKMDGDAVAKALSDERVKASETWAERRASATNENELQLQVALTALGQLLAKAQDGAKTPGIEAYKNAQAAKQAEAEFDIEWKAMALTLESLGTQDIDAPAPLLARAQTFRETAQAKPDDAAAWKEALKLLRLEHGQARTVINQKEMTLYNQRQAVLTEFNNATTALAKVTAPMKKRFAELVAALQTEMLELRTMGEGTNTQAGQQAITDLKALTERINQLAATPMTTAPVIKTVAQFKAGGLDDEKAQAEYDKQLLDVQNKATLGTVARDLDAFKLRLKTAKAEFGKDHPAGVRQLQQSLKVFESQVQGMQPNLATAELQDLNAALDLAQSLVGTLKTERVTAANTVKDIGLQVAELRKAGRYKEYVDSVADQLKGLIGEQKSAREPAAVSSLLRRASLLLKQVLDARAKPTGLQEQQDKLTSAELKQQQLESEWIGHFPSNTAWEGRFLSQARDAIAQNKGDEGQIKEIRNIVKRAVKLHKDGDLVNAIRQIKLAEARVREVVADPMGPALGRRKALMDNARQYSADARELVSLLSLLPERAAERVPTLEPTVKNSIKTLAERAANRIAPEALTGFALELDAADLPDNKLRELREQAMAQTRSLRDLMTKHPLMVQLAQTPINRAIPNVMRRLNQHINRFEANVSRAVK